MLNAHVYENNHLDSPVDGMGRGGSMFPILLYGRFVLDISRGVESDKCALAALGYLLGVVLLPYRGYGGDYGNSHRLHANT